MWRKKKTTFRLGTMGVQAVENHMKCEMAAQMSTPQTFHNSCLFVI